MKTSPSSKSKLRASTKQITPVKKQNPKIALLKNSSQIKKNKLKEISKFNLQAVEPQIENFKKETKENLVKVNKQSRLGLHKKKKARLLDKPDKKSAIKNPENPERVFARTEDEKDEVKKIKKSKKVRPQQPQNNSVRLNKKVDSNKLSHDKNNEENKTALRPGMKRKRTHKKEKENLKKGDSKKNPTKSKENKCKEDEDETNSKRNRRNRLMPVEIPENEEVSDFSLKDLSKKHILQCITAIFHLTQEQIKDKNELLAESKPIFLQVTCIRVPRVPKRNVRM